MKNFLIGLFFGVQYIMAGAFMTLIDVPLNLHLSLGVSQEAAELAVNAVLAILYTLMYRAVVTQEDDTEKE